MLRNIQRAPRVKIFAGIPCWLVITPTMIVASKRALAITIAAQTKAATKLTYTRVRLLRRESSSRRSSDFTDAMYGLLHRECHVLG